MLVIVYLLVGICGAQTNTFNHIDKLDLYKNKYVEQKFEEILISLKHLKSEVSSLKKINKKLLKYANHKDVMYSDTPRRHGTKGVHSIITSPLVASQRQGNCPTGFEYSTHTSCYHIEAERVTWPEAKSMCESIGGSLLSIESRSEQSYITEHISNSRVYRHCDVWTSGSDANKEGTWEWMMSSSSKPLTFTNWQRDEPNNGGGREHCLWMDWYFAWKWNDAKCDTDKACFICETMKS